MEFLIFRLADHEDTPSTMQHKVHWFGYPLSADTLEASDALLEKIIRKYWNLVQQRRAKSSEGHTS